MNASACIKEDMCYSKGLHVSKSHVESHKSMNTENWLLDKLNLIKSQK